LIVLPDRKGLTSVLDKSTKSFPAFSKYIPRSLNTAVHITQGFACLGTLALAGNQIQWPELRKLHQTHIASLQLLGNPLASDANCKCGSR
jgi:hypothetical protein